MITKPSPISIERLALTDFRNYAAVAFEVRAGPVVLTGPNGAGKTNLLEAISLLAPGQGLRRTPYDELARKDGGGGWAVAARVHGRQGTADLGTGLVENAGGERAGRAVRIDGRPARGSGALARHLDLLWLTPAMDGLFTGPASERRRFLDRLVLCFDEAYGARVNRFELAMRNRNRLLAEGVRDAARFEGFEIIMAETGVAIAAARREAVRALCCVIAENRAEIETAFPWANVAVPGTLEKDLEDRAALDVEEAYLATLAQGRERDRAAGRTLEGPHRSDFVVVHGPKDRPAGACSTGEQKAILIGLVLAHAELLARRHGGTAPILLLDEVAAHLDETRRSALFGELLRLGAQAWMTGTDQRAFEPLEGAAEFWHVEDGTLARRGSDARLPAGTT